MNRLLKWTALALAVTLPLSAQAHRAWMLPSATVLSGEEPWVTVDAAVSNDLFYFEHFPLQLEGIGKPLALPARGPQAAPAAAQGDQPAAPAPMRRPANTLVILAPDGTPVEPQNGAVGRYRTTFDVQLTQKGTYKLAVANQGLMASWKENGVAHRWMGKLEDLSKSIPTQADELRVTQGSNRMEVFVTSGDTTTSVLKPTKVGLELVPVTHPNDLFAGETATFDFLLDGKPAADVDVTVIPGGNRYRDSTNELTLKTDSKGRLTVTWPAPGMYWLEAELRTDKGVKKPVTERRASYSATLEVLAP